MARIGYVCERGVGHDLLWLSALVDSGHEVICLASTPVAGTLPDGGVPVRWHGPADLRALAEQHALEMLVAGPLTSAAVAAVDADVVPTFGISWAFDLLVDLLDPAHEAALRRTVPRLAGLHVDSAPLARSAERLGVPASRISSASWGIDTAFFSPGSPRSDLVRRAGGEGSRMMFSARSWEPIYDVPTVVQGFALARQQEPALRLVLGGDGSQAHRLEREIARVGLAPFVLCIGRADASTVRDWLRCADVYVSAARSDGSSLSLIEALAVGVPAVVTDLETNREWISGPQLGALFAPGDAQLLAQSVLAQLAAPDPAGPAARRAVAVRRGDRAANRRVFSAALDAALRASR